MAVAKTTIKEYDNTAHLNSGRKANRSNQYSYNSNKTQSGSSQTKTTQPAKRNRVGRPTQFSFGKVKNLATGDTRNSPFTDPNIIFFVGIGLIIVSQLSKIKRIFVDAWGFNSSTNLQSFGNDFKDVGIDILFIFILTVTARIFPFLARIWLVILGGLWILFLMKNPQALQLLRVSSE